MSVQVTLAHPNHHIYGPITLETLHCSCDFLSDESKTEGKQFSERNAGDKLL